MRERDDALYVCCCTAATRDSEGGKRRRRCLLHPTLPFSRRAGCRRHFLTAAIRKRFGILHYNAFRFGRPSLRPVLICSDLAAWREERGGCWGEKGILQQIDPSLKMLHHPCVRRLFLRFPHGVGPTVQQKKKTGSLRIFIIQSYFVEAECMNSLLYLLKNDLFFSINQLPIAERKEKKSRCGNI